VSQENPDTPNPNQDLNPADTEQQFAPEGLPPEPVRIAPPMQRLEGKIIRLLEDDEIGDRHQRFVMELHGGRTVLVAHNIDVAPRVEGLFIGGWIEVYGELAHNDLGGVMHWTHSDPNGQVEGGWIEFRNRRYE